MWVSGSGRCREKVVISKQSVGVLALSEGSRRGTGVFRETEAGSHREEQVDKVCAPVSVCVWASLMGKQGIIKDREVRLMGLRQGWC